jgi:hypothetical protein
VKRERERENNLQSKERKHDGKKKERYSRTIEEKLLSFQNNGYLHNAKASGFTKDRSRVAANEDEEEMLQYKEELDSNAGAKTNDKAGFPAALRLCGFSIGSGESAKDRQKREGGSEGAGWRVAGTGFVRTVEDTVFPSRWVPLFPITVPS